MPEPSPLPTVPFVIGHRGCGRGTSAGGHVENTVAGFVGAAALGASWVEMDARLNADHELVLNHGARRRLSAISAMSSAECSRAGVATLAEVHAALPAGVGIYLEVKLPPLRRMVRARLGLSDAGGEATIAAALAWAGLAGLAGGQRPALVASFDRAAAGAAGAAGLAAAWVRWWCHSVYESVAVAGAAGCTVLVARAGDVLAVRPDHQRPGVLAGQMAAHGVALWAWNVRAGDVDSLICAGVTGMCTDDIAGVAAAVRAHQGCVGRR